MISAARIEIIYILEKNSTVALVQKQLKNFNFLTTPISKSCDMLLVLFLWNVLCKLKTTQIKDILMVEIDILEGIKFTQETTCDDIYIMPLIHESEDYQELMVEKSENHCNYKSFKLKERISWMYKYLETNNKGLFPFVKQIFNKDCKKRKFSEFITDEKINNPTEIKNVSKEYGEARKFLLNLQRKNLINSKHHFVVYRNEKDGKMHFTFFLNILDNIYVLQIMFGLNKKDVEKEKYGVGFTFVIDDTRVFMGIKNTNTSNFFVKSTVLKNLSDFKNKRMMNILKEDEYTARCSYGYMKKDKIVQKTILEYSEEVDETECLPSHREKPESTEIEKQKEKMSLSTILMIVGAVLGGASVSVVILYVYIRHKNNKKIQWENRDLFLDDRINHKSKYGEYCRNKRNKL